MSPSNPSEITLHVSPSPSAFFRHIAIIHCLAFSNSGLSRWWSSTQSDAIINSVDEIPSLRLYKTIREYVHKELHPGTIVVCAVIDNQVVGCATWGPPKRLWRSERLVEMLYRKGIEAKDAIEDWLFPLRWYNHSKREEFHRLQEECMEKFMGQNGIDEMWYLKTLAVHPGFQRRGVGAILLDWGLNHARERGEKVYLEASESGKGLYLKKGFKELGDLVPGDKEVLLPCMVWDPNIAPS